MAIHLNNEIVYKEAVLADREENHYDDSDFYAVVWDEDGQKCKRVDYNTTRFAGGGGCLVDATEEVKQKAQKWLENYWFDRLLYRAKENSIIPDVGKRVRVVKGRKVSHGTEGVIFLKRGRTFSPRFSNGYKQGPDTWQIGLALTDKKENNYKVVEENGFLYYTPFKSEEFRRVALSVGGKWDAQRRAWFFTNDYQELREIADRLYTKYSDVAWTYANNVAVVDPEQYVDEDEIRKQAIAMAAQRCFYAPFSRMSVCLY